MNKATLVRLGWLPGIVICTVLSSCGGGSSHSQESVDVDGQLSSATTLEQYLKRGYIDSYSGSNNYDTDDTTGTETATDGVADADSSADESGYSTTNTQESGVDEADLIKQNGNYLYAVQQPMPAWLDSDSPTEPQILSWATSDDPVSSSLQGTTSLTGAYSVDGLYLLDQQLVALTRSGVDGTQHTGYSSVAEVDDYYSPWYWKSYSTDIRLLDLADPAQPNQSYQLSIEGYLLSSRVVDGQLYLVSKFTPAIEAPYGSDLSVNEWQQQVLDTPIEDLLPRVWIDGEVSGHLFEDGDCNVPDLTAANSYNGYPSIVSLIRVNLSDPSDWQASCNSGRISGVYASTDAFILTGYTDSRWDATRLDWYDLDSFSLIASGSVPGTLDGTLPSFRLSERAGLLRILTSSWNWSVWDDVAIDDVDEWQPEVSTNSDDSTSSSATDSTTVESSDDWQHRLFILKPASDGSLDLVAQLPNSERTSVIGKPGEDVKSVRYFGERAYVVTFEQTDPLYVINLSDSSDPYIEGELEITGFSSYLHPLNDTLLLGLGQAADDSGFTQGVKLSLFDTSDPANPTEISSLELGSRGSWSDALYDHHAISFMDTDSGVRLAFSWSEYEDWNWQGNRIFVADINTSPDTITDTGSLTTRLNQTYQSADDDNYRYYYGYSRVALQGAGLHLISNGTVESGTLESW